MSKIRDEAERMLSKESMGVPGDMFYTDAGRQAKRVLLLDKAYQTLLEAITIGQRDFETLEEMYEDCKEVEMLICQAAALHKQAEEM